MAKRKENKDQESVLTVASASGASKDIDDIFAKSPATDPVRKESLKQTAESGPHLESTPRAPFNEELANVHRKVQAARGVKPIVAPHRSGQDDFADIRGTKKRKCRPLN